MSVSKYCKASIRFRQDPLICRADAASNATSRETSPDRRFPPNASTGSWYQQYGLNGALFGEQFGVETDRIAQADYDGDGKTDIAIYRPAEGLWCHKGGATGTSTPDLFGLASDVPVPGDYDGDGKADLGVFRPSDDFWYIVNSTNGGFTILPWGQNGDRPTPGAFLN